MLPDKLDGAANFQTWKFEVMLYLKHEGLWDIATTEPSAANLADDEWKRKDDKAFTIIGLLCKPNAQAHIRSKKHAYHAWTALEKAYQDVGLNRKLSLMTSLLSQRLTDFPSMDLYIASIMDLSYRLSEMGSQVPDDFLGAIMLKGLTTPYQIMVSALENSNLNLTSELVRSKLISEEHRLNSTEASENALFSRSGPKPKGASKANKKCFNCGQKGHFKYQCRVNNDKTSGDSDGRPCASRGKVNPSNFGSKTSREALFSALNVTSVKEDVWVLDSGASNHYSCRSDWFKSLDKETELPSVSLADSSKLSCEGKGNINVDFENGVKKTITDAYYVPQLAVNHLSVSKLVHKGYTVVFDHGQCQIFSNVQIQGKPELVGKEVNGLFEIRTERHVVNSVTSSKNLWHLRLGHLNQSYMDRIKSKEVGVVYSDQLSDCIDCIRGKQRKLPYPESSSSVRSVQKLELLHCDLVGPIPEPSFSGSRYMMTIVDDFTRKVWVFFLKLKSEVYDKFLEFKLRIEKQTGLSIKRFRSDNGSEFCNQKIEDLFKSTGIIHETTVEYTPQNNSVCERVQGTICDKARSMLLSASLDAKFWAEACSTAAYLYNRSPHRMLEFQIPQELWSGHRVKLGHLRVFGCRAFVHVPKCKRSKWDFKSRECIFLGYNGNSPGYRFMLNNKSFKIVRGRDVIFMEDSFPGKDQDQRSHIDYDDLFNGSHVGFKPIETVHSPAIEGGVPNVNDVFVEPVVVDNLVDDIVVDNLVDDTVVDNVIDNVDSTVDDVGGSVGDALIDGNVSNEINGTVSQNVCDSDLGVLPERRYPLRTRRQVQFPDHVVYKVNLADEPLTYQEAMSSPDRDKWKRAMTDEISSFLENQVGSLTQLPPGKKAIPTKWVFKSKQNPLGDNIYRARLVAKGCSQRLGLDYQETFSPVIAHSTIRILFALAVEMNLDILHWDIKTAFFYGNLCDEIYIKQPDGFVDESNNGLVFRLNKSMYGLKQAAKCWNDTISSFLMELGFGRLEGEPCVFQLVREKAFIVLALYVDDILSFSNDQRLAEFVKSKLAARFQIHDLGELSSFLGMKVQRDRKAGKLFVDQSSYAAKVLQSFGMDQCNPVATPMSPDFLRTAGSIPKTNAPDENIPYQSLVGSLMYLCLCTRPDLFYPVCVMSQFNTCYTKEHFTYLKRLLRYVKGTMNYGLLFEKTGKIALEGYVDADWANDCLDRKSYSGFVFLMSGGPISWLSRKQSCVTLSSTEAEYVALSEACKEAVNLVNILSGLRFVNFAGNCVLFNDNMSAQKIAHAVSSKRTKHIDLRFHYVRNAVADGLVDLRHLSSQEMLADVLTKPLPRVSHYRCIHGFNMKKYA